MARPIKFFALDGAAGLGHRVAAALNSPVAAHEARLFEDGEYKIRPLEEVDGCDVYLLESLHGTVGESVHDKLVRLLIFIGALKDAGAERVTVIAPYLCYARKDRRTKLRDPITVRYLAALFEAVGTDTVVVLDVHNLAAFENAFRCRTVSLTAAGLFAPLVKAPSEKLCVVSPDPGGVKRAELFRRTLETSFGSAVAKGFVDKRRSAGVLSGELFVGDAEGATAIIIDDLISTGSTMVRAAHAALAAGATKVVALATHGLFNRDAISVLADPAIAHWVVTDSVVPANGALGGKVEVISCAELLAEAVRCLNAGQSLEKLLGY